MVFTLGPSSSGSDVLRRLIASGMDVARLNFSHGEHSLHRETYDRLRRLSSEAGRDVAVLADLQGPKIRTGKLRGGAPVELVEGASFCITTREIEGDGRCVSTTYQELPGDVRQGDRILLADGAMELRVESVESSDVQCRVVRGGLLGERKGINLPGVAVSAPSLTEKDIEDLAFATELGVDYVALSFVRTAGDVRAVKQHIERLCGARGAKNLPGVVAKIERPEALAAFDQILALTDAVMVARGDLGIEVDLDNIPQIQKSLIRKCRAWGTPVITATQMLESMMTSPRPTRAEVSDVANAIYDGTDAVMLSGETAAGRFPVEAAETMADVAAKADLAIAETPGNIAADSDSDGPWRGTHADAIGEAVAHMTRSMDIARIVCFTQSGFTARAIARYRPHTPITAITLNEQTRRRCALYWGVDALHTNDVAGVDQMLPVVDRLLFDHGLAACGDTVVVVAGTPWAAGGQTNLLQLHTVGSSA